MSSDRETTRREIGVGTSAVTLADLSDTANEHVAIDVQLRGVPGVSHDLLDGEESQLPCDIPECASVALTRPRPDDA